MNAVNAKGKDPIGLPELIWGPDHPLWLHRDFPIRSWGLFETETPPNMQRWWPYMLLGRKLKEEWSGDCIELKAFEAFRTLHLVSGRDISRYQAIEVKMAARALRAASKVGKLEMVARIVDGHSPAELRSVWFPAPGDWLHAKRRGRPTKDLAYKAFVSAAYLTQAKKSNKEGALDLRALWTPIWLKETRTLVCDLASEEILSRTTTHVPSKDYPGGKVSEPKGTLGRAKLSEKLPAVFDELFEGCLAFHQNS